MKSGFDINRITGDGYLILPLSMANLAKGKKQDPQACYEALQFFAAKLQTYSSDVVLLYTTGLYLNTMDIAYERRVKLNQEAIQHARTLQKLIEKGREFIPPAFHYLPIDYIVLNSPYTEFFAQLKKCVKSDTEFKAAIITDSGEREFTEAQENFMLEEITVSHILRNHHVVLPRTLVKNDDWRLIVYPGEAISGDVYVWRHNLLPKNNRNPYNAGVYDYSKKQYINFDG